MSYCLKGTRIKKIASIIAITIVGIFLLSACSKGGGPGASQKSQEAPKSAQEEKYPTRPIEFIVPWGPGGGADQLARKSATLLEKILGVPLPVVNVPGATGGTGMSKLLAAPADGYSMAIYIGDSHAVLGTGAASWKMEDIVAVARMIKAPSFLFVRYDDNRFKTWADFEKEAKAKPGQLKVATLGKGSLDHLTLAYLASKGIQVTDVPYANPGERYTALLGGHVDALYEQAGDVRQYITGNQIRPIIIFNEERYPAFKDVPCSKELGYDIYLPQFRTIVVKAGTAKEKVKKLSEAFKQVYNDPEYQKFLEEQYGTKDSFMDGDTATAFLKSELDTYVKLMTQFGLRK